MLKFQQQLFLLLVCKEGFEKDPDMGCKRCDKGTYSDVKDAESCTPCPDGQTTMWPESKSVDDCYGKKRTILEIDLCLTF